MVVKSCPPGSRSRYLPTDHGGSETSFRQTSALRFLGVRVASLLVENFVYLCALFTPALGGEPGGALGLSDLNQAPGVKEFEQGDEGMRGRIQRPSFSAAPSPCELEQKLNYRGARANSCSHCTVAQTVKTAQWGRAQRRGPASRSGCHTGRKKRGLPDFTRCRTLLENDS